MQRVVDQLLDGIDRSLALDDHTIDSRRRGGASADTDATAEADDDAGTGASLELPTFVAVVNAVQSPPFMTDCRVVVVREIGNLTGEQGKWLAEWIANPLEGVHLVLVTGGGRVPSALDKAAKANAEVVGPASEQTAAALANAIRDAWLKLSSGAAARIATHLGDDAGRVPELVELLLATYGTKATLDVDAVEAYLGELGTAGRFDLTNFIDRGELGPALETLHRMLTATSASQPKPLHPMQVMASLVFHYQRLLRLDDPTITTKERAAEVLGMKSAGERGSRSKRRGSWEATACAKPSGCSPRRSSTYAVRAGSTNAPRSTCWWRGWRRSAGATHAGRRAHPRPAPRRKEEKKSSARVGRAVRPAHHPRRAARGLVLVDHAGGRGLAEPLLRRLHELFGVVGAVLDRGRGDLHACLELGADGLVALAPALVLAVPLLL